MCILPCNWHGSIFLFWTASLSLNVTCSPQSHIKSTCTTSKCAKTTNRHTTNITFWQPLLRLHFTRQIQLCIDWNLHLHVHCDVKKSTMPRINFFGSFHHRSVQCFWQLETDNSSYKCDDTKDDKVNIRIHTALDSNTNTLLCLW